MVDASGNRNTSSQVSLTVPTGFNRNLLRVGDELLEETQLFAPVNPDGATTLSLPPGESLTVPFTICLEQRTPFELLVNVRGTPAD